MKARFSDFSKRMRIENFAKRLDSYLAEILHGRVCATAFKKDEAMVHRNLTQRIRERIFEQSCKVRIPEQ